MSNIKNHVTWYDKEFAKYEILYATGEISYHEYAALVSSLENELEQQDDVQYELESENE